MELKEIHNCKESKGRLVCISMDKLGRTCCSYCYKQVDYSGLYHCQTGQEEMKLKFKRPLVPNFVLTEQGTFTLASLSEEEITEYAEVWCARLKERREELLKLSRTEGGK